MSPENVEMASPLASPAAAKEFSSPPCSFPAANGPSGAPPPRSFADAVRGDPPLSQQPASHFMNPDSPRVGNISSSNGVSMAVFSAEEVSKLATPFQHTLVGKFSFGRPQLGVIRQHLVNLGCSSVRVQLLNQRHVLIFLNNADEFAKLWLRREVFIDSLPMRLFKWSPSFNVKHEPSVAPVWIRISGLPIHLFDKRALFTIGGLIGEPIKIDEATCKLSRIEFARICIEIDVRQQPPAEICVMNAGELICVPVVYERLPKYCSHCHHLGHEENACYITQAGPRPWRNLRKQPDIQSKGKEKVTELDPKESTPCPAAAFGEMADVDSITDAAAHVANMDAAAAAAVSPAAHAPDHVPQQAHASLVQQNSSAPIGKHANGASKDIEECTLNTQAQNFNYLSPSNAENFPQNSVNDNVKDEEVKKKKEKKHKNEENGEKRKKKVKKKQTIKIPMPDFLPGENQSAYAMRVLQIEL